MHRIGGMEKEDGSGDINYTPENHERMVHLRAREDRRHRRRHPARRDRRRRGRRAVHPRVGLDVGGDRRRRAAHPPRRHEAGLGAHHPPQPAAEEPRRAAAAVPEDHRARAEPRPAVPHRACRVPRRRQVDQQGAGPALHRHRDRSRHRRGGSRVDDRHRSSPSPRKKDWTSDQEVRWCPGCGDYGILLAVQQLMPELGVRPGEHRVHLGHRLLEPLPVLHEHVRDALDPRARPGHRHRCRRRPARPRRVGDHRRRRRPVDRRQPPDPRPAAQRQPDDPAVQQPDLRADQGSVLADVASSARSPSRRRSARSTRRSTR